LSIDTKSLKVTITHSGGKYLTTGVDQWSSSEPNLAHMLGFTKPMSPTQTLTSDQMINFSPRNLVHIYSQRLGAKLGDNWHSSYPNDRNIMQSLHVVEPFGSWMSSMFHSASYMTFDSSGSRQLIDMVDLSFRDEFLQEIDFKNHPFYIDLSFI